MARFVHYLTHRAQVSSDGRQKGRCRPTGRPHPALDARVPEECAAQGSAPELASLR
ncbi:hypothetical protein BLAT2472_10636 [Burkholderia latens]